MPAVHKNIPIPTKTADSSISGALALLTEVGDMATIPIGANQKSRRASISSACARLGIRVFVSNKMPPQVSVAEPSFAVWRVQ